MYIPLHALWYEVFLFPSTINTIIRDNIHMCKSGHLYIISLDTCESTHASLDNPRYEVFLFSKPDTLLAWASLPIIKLMQIRYVNDSLSALAKAVQ